MVQQGGAPRTRCRNRKAGEAQGPQRRTLPEFQLEMKTLRIRNWDKWQSYRNDRKQPPWIKLHRRLLQDWDFISLTCAQRGQLMTLWMLAADRDGEIPADPLVIQKLCHIDDEIDLQVFIDHGFIEDGCQSDAKLASTRRQSDAPEEKRREKIRKEKKQTKKENRTDYPTALNIGAWEEYLRYRREAKMRKLTPAGERLQIEKLIRFGDHSRQQACIEETIRNGWQGIFEPRGSPAKQSKADEHFEAIRNL